MFARRLYEINLRLFTEELSKLGNGTVYAAGDIVVIRDYIKRLEAILAKIPDPMPVLTVNIPAGRQNPFSVYDRATKPEVRGKNVVQYPKRKIGEKQRELIGMLGCTANDLGDVFYGEVSAWPGDEYA